MTSEMTEYVVPMYESERGWGAKIDGYAGPFPSLERAEAFMRAYNLKNNSEERVPDYYIAALKPTERRGVECAYKTTVDDIDYALAKARNEQVKQIAENANCSSPVERPSQHGDSNDE
jgi:hypothetical protein